MARVYTPEEKAYALDVLHEKRGNVPYVSYLLGISQRTLYTWRKYAAYEARGEQPRHWIREQPQYQERLQQQRETRVQQQQQRNQINHAFGMTNAELEEALKVEFIPSDYTNMHADLILHLQHLSYSLTDEPESAHLKALGFRRILDTALTLEEKLRIEKPQLTVIKYEYPDGTYHDMPFWSNAVHERAQHAYEAVVAEAKRQYEEQQAALRESVQAATAEETAMPTNESAQPTDSAETASSAESTSPYIEEEDANWYLSNPSLEELLTKPFKPEDFVPKHTGYHKYFLGENPSPRPKHLGDLPIPPNEDEDNPNDW